MNKDSFLEMTGQATKFFIGMGLFLMIGVLLVWMFVYGELTDYFPL